MLFICIISLGYCHEVYCHRGASDFIGSHMIEAIAGSHEVVVIDNFSVGNGKT